MYRPEQVPTFNRNALGVTRRPNVTHQAKNTACFLAHRQAQPHNPRKPHLRCDREDFGPLDVLASGGVAAEVSALLKGTVS